MDVVIGATGGCTACGITKQSAIDSNTGRAVDVPGNV